MNFDEAQAIYLQIADYIAEKILVSEWPEGERIPSVRETAKNLKVNVNTVMRSYNFLQDKQFIVNQRGIGYFVAPSAAQMVTEWKREEFKHNLLPKIFHQAKVLNYSREEMDALYSQFLENQE